MTTAIPRDEIRFHQHSFGDPAGRLFWWDGELYRGVRSSHADFVRDIVETVLPSLSARRLVPETILTGLATEGFELVLRHEQIPLAAYPTEWCPAMLRGAALLYLDLVLELAPRGLGIKDMNPWNIVFDGTRPLFVDVMSIAPLAECRTSFTEERFRRHYVDPLRLMVDGHSGLARALLPDYGGVDPTTFAQIERSRRPRLRRNRVLEPEGLARVLMREVEALRPPTSSLTVTGDPSLDDLLFELRPESVLELRTATGAAAAAAARRGSRAIGFFESDGPANSVFADASADALWLLPLVVDFTKATPAVGLFDHFAISAVDRLSCELVVAGDAVRYAVVDRLLPFEHIVEALAAFSMRYAVAALPAVNELPAHALARAPWYGVSAFADALRVRFAEVTPLAAAPTEAGRFLCRK
jgi:hypothetical protein